MKPVFKKELENGLKIIAEKIPNKKKMAIMIATKVGSVDESERINGGSHFIEHLYFKSNKFMNEEEIVDNLEYYGAYSNAYTEWKYTKTVNKVASKYGKRIIEILLKGVFNFNFHKEEFEKERKVILTELNNYINNPERYSLYKLFIPSLYRNTPLEKTIDGTQKSISEMKKEGLEEFKRKFYKPNNMVVAVNGKFDSSFLKFLENEFSVFEKGKIPERKKIDLKNRHFERFEARKDINQMYLCMGWKVPGFKSNEHHNLELLSTYLGYGLSSKLFKELRIKRGIGYSVRCHYIPLDYEGIFCFHISGFDPERFEEVVDTLISIKDQLRNENIPERDLKRSKNLLISEYQDTLEDLMSRCILMLEGEIYGKNYDFRKKEQIIEEIKAEDLRITSGKYLGDNFTLTALHPENFKI